MKVNEAHYILDLNVSFFGKIDFLHCEVLFFQSLNWWTSNDSRLPMILGLLVSICQLIDAFCKRDIWWLLIKGIVLIRRHNNIIFQWLSLEENIPSLELSLQFSPFIFVGILPKFASVLSHLLVNCHLFAQYCSQSDCLGFIIIFGIIGRFCMRTVELRRSNSLNMYTLHFFDMAKAI